MVSSVNDKIRKNIINETSIPITLFNIEQLDIDESREVIKLFISDYYKINFFENILHGESDSLNIFNKPIESLVDDCLKNREFLIEIMESAAIFNSLDAIAKIIIMEQLESYGKDDILIKISKLHVFDKIAYNFSYDLESFKYYYNDYKNNSTKVEKNTNVSIFIANKIIEYKKENYNKYKKFILEFVKEYYKWNIFIKENGDKNSLYNEDYLYLEIIKFNSIENLINYIESDFNFLVTLIENYLYYSTGDKDISKPIVNEYYYNNVDKEIQKKLQTKRD